MDTPLPRNTADEQEPLFRPHTDELSSLRNKDKGKSVRDSQESADERITTLSSLALASGTGKDVTSFGIHMRRPRYELSKVSLRAIAIIVATVVACAWLLISQASSSQSDQSTAQSAETSPTSLSEKTQPLEEEKGEKTQESDTAASSHTEKIVVYVSGAVVTPGVYSLAAGSRVNDAIGAAGGEKDNADLSEINLALPLQDADHVHIPGGDEQKNDIENQARASTESSNMSEKEQKHNVGRAQGSDKNIRKININTATANQLQEIPGVGPVMAHSIIEWRKTHGKFSSVEELLNVSGIGEKTLEKMRASIAVR